MNGIRVRWTRQRDEKMESYLTFDQVRARFGLGGTPDGLVRRRMGQVATTSDICAAAEELGDPKMTTWSTSRILGAEIIQIGEIPDPEPPVCSGCHRPL